MVRTASHKLLNIEIRAKMSKNLDIKCYMTDIKEAFQMFDKNGDGKIGTKELDKVLRHMGQNPTQAEVEQMIRNADQNGNIC